MTESELLDFFARQARAVDLGDLDGLMSHYADDAIMVRADRVAAGRDAIEALFRDYLALNPAIIGLDAARAQDDTIVYVAGIRVAGRDRRATGALVLRDGLIWRQVAFFDPPLD
jgi:ketosteroid isomerase-like protein